MEIHCVENLHYYTRDCYHCSTTGCPPVKPMRLYKAGERSLPEAPTIWSHGSPLVFLLSPSSILCSAFQQKMLEENLRVTREVPGTSFYNPASLSECWTSCPCIFQWGRFSEDEWHLVVSYSWGSQVVGAQDLASLVKRLNLVTMYLGRRRNSFARCKKRSCEATTVICLLALETFLPEYEYHYSLNRNNKFV